MSKIIVVSLIIFSIAGCASSSSSRDDNGREILTLNCLNDKACKQKATETCPNGFRVLDTDDGGYMKIICEKRFL